jgi:hypothetical protein
MILDLYSLGAFINLELTIPYSANGYPSAEERKTWITLFRSPEQTVSWGSTSASVTTGRKYAITQLQFDTRLRTSRLRIFVASSEFLAGSS